MILGRLLRWLVRPVRAKPKPPEPPPPPVFIRVSGTLILTAEPPKTDKEST